MLDWDDLRARATEVAQNAWAPYSGLKVGAAGVTDEGDHVAGCNVENASYGLTLCAECGLVSELHRRAAGRLVAIAARSSDGVCLMPCGRCRQILLEAGGPELLVDHPDGALPLAELLPHSFDADQLPRTGKANRQSEL